MEPILRRQCHQSGLTVVASVVSSLSASFAFTALGCPLILPSYFSQSYMTSIYNVLIYPLNPPLALAYLSIVISTSPFNLRVPQISLPNSLLWVSPVATHASTILSMPSARSSTSFSRMPLSSEVQRTRPMLVVSSPDKKKEEKKEEKS